MTFPSDLENYSHTCMCGAYPWPHYVGIGKCSVSNLDEPVCACCGQPSPDIKKVDWGIGSYEYWGQRGVHHDHRVVTSCCECEELLSPRIGDTRELTNDDLGGAW